MVMSFVIFMTTAQFIAGVGCMFDTPLEYYLTYPGDERF